jgi:hydrogenase expression/formation protein HypC
MCVGIPGQIVSIVDAATDTAVVEIGGIRRAINISFVVGDGRRHADCIGEWVLVHVGFAMSRIDAGEAVKTLELLRELGEMDQELAAIGRMEAAS